MYVLVRLMYTGQKASKYISRILLNIFQPLKQVVVLDTFSSKITNGFLLFAFSSLDS